MYELMQWLSRRLPKDGSWFLTLLFFPFFLLSVVAIFAWCAVISIPLRWLIARCGDGDIT